MPLPRGPEPGAAARGRATIRLRADDAAVLELESFIAGLDFLRPLERSRMILAGDEILDNLVRHASPLRDGLVLVRATREADRLILGFYFHSPSFASFASRCGDPEPLFEPLFDPEGRRWRGLGLVMCRNLCLGIDMRPGARLDRIYLRFAPAK